MICLKAYNYITRKKWKNTYLYLNKHIQLSELDRKIILKQVQGYYMKMLIWLMIILNLSKCWK